MSKSSRLAGGQLKSSSVPKRRAQERLSGKILERLSVSHGTNFGSSTEHILIRSQASGFRGAQNSGCHCIPYSVSEF